METNKQEFTEEEIMRIANEFVKSNSAELPEAMNYDAIKSDLKKAWGIWIGLEEIKGHSELLNWAIRIRFENLSVVSTLAATLLVIATFNDKLIVLDNWVRVLLTVLLLLIPGSLWALFYETSKAANDSFEKIRSITLKEIGEEPAKKLDQAKKLSFRGSIPAIIYAIFTIVSLCIILLIWR